MQRVKLILLACFILLAAYEVRAQTANPYQLTGSISAGGAIAGGSYTVGVALGQVSAGEASGGTYTLGGGIFGGQVTQPQPPSRFVYVPMVRR